MPSGGTMLDVGALRRGGSRPSPVQPQRGDSRLRMLPDGAIDYAIVMLGPHGMVLTWSAGAERIFRYTSSEIIGQDWSLLLRDPTHPEDAAAQALCRAAKSGRHEEQSWLVRQDGERFWANLVLTPLRDPAGRLRGFGLVARDLTERIRGLELLAVLDAASDSILGVDACGRIMFLNAAAVSTFGYSRDELLGQPVECLMPEHIRGRHPEHRRAYCDNPQPRPMGGGLALAAVRKDGTCFPAEISLSSVSTQWGRITTATVRDLTPA
jgi:two-component system, cell cycle sensor histidine kinase and response regulator CckA